MTRLNIFDNRPDYTRPLYNEKGRISFCTCCCENLPASLFLHLEATFIDSHLGTNNPDCELHDQGPLMSDTQGAYPLPSDIASGHCNDWTTTNETSESFPVCFGGTRAEPFGIEAVLFCQPTNQFRLDICWGAFGTGHPVDFPVDKSDCALPNDGVHDFGLQGIEATSKTCDAIPGEFFIDFGNFRPPHCQCLFHVYIDELSDLVTFEKDPLYEYPVRGAAKLQSGVRSMARHYEQLPDIGTPPEDVDSAF